MSQPSSAVGDRASLRKASVSSTVSEKPPKIHVRILSNEVFSEEQLNQGNLDGKTLTEEPGIVAQSAIKPVPTNEKFEINVDSLKKDPFGDFNPTAAHDDGVRTNLGNTKVVMNLLSEMWIFHLAFILGFTYFMTFYIDQGYTDTELWNNSCYWKLGN